MIEAVFVFGALNILFEFVLLSMLAPRWRLRLLGSEPAKASCHIGMLLINIAVHWGTLVGTMASIVAFVASIATIYVASRLFGSIRDSRYYTVGYIRYSKEELL